VISQTAARHELSSIALGSATEPADQVLALASLVIADEIRMNNLVTIRAFGLAAAEHEPAVAKKIAEYVRQATE
jgi:hypothetical protein